MATRRLTGRQFRRLVENMVEAKSRNRFVDDVWRAVDYAKDVRKQNKGVGAEDADWDDVGHELGSDFRAMSAEEVAEMYDALGTPRGDKELAQAAKNEALAAGDKSLASWIEEAMAAGLDGAMDEWARDELEDSGGDFEDEDEDEDEDERPGRR